LSEKGDTANGVLLKKVEELERELGNVMRENKETKAKLGKIEDLSREEIEKLQNKCEFLKKSNATQKEKISELTQQNSELILRNSGDLQIEEKFSGKKENKEKKKILKLKSLNKRMVEENKNILKSEEEISVKYLELSKNFEKLMEEKMAGKIDSETVKELREENKKLKKNEVELRGKLEKITKSK